VKCGYLLHNRGLATMVQQCNGEFPTSFCVNMGSYGDFTILNGLEELLFEHQSVKCRYQIEAWYLNAPNPSFLVMTTIRF